MLHFFIIIGFIKIIDFYHSSPSLKISTGVFLLMIKTGIIRLNIKINVTMIADIQILFLSNDNPNVADILKLSITEYIAIANDDEQINITAVYAAQILIQWFQFIPQVNSVP